MNSSLSWKNIVHKAKCSDFPRKTHHQKNLILTVVASSLTRVSHSDAIFSESLPLTFVFKTVVECRIAKCWQSHPTPALPPSKKKTLAVLFSWAVSLVVCFFICPWSLYESISIWFLYASTKKWKNQTTRIFASFKKKKKLATSLRIQALGVLEFSHWVIAESSLSKRVPNWYDSVLESEPARNHKIWFRYAGCAKCLQNNK